MRPVKPVDPPKVAKTIHPIPVRPLVPVKRVYKYVQLDSSP
jgi:hypothetical protein